ncbi:actin-associated protein FAM107A isoform X2 [Oryx dammah]|uniref:actin-associated protein FAM107A isoform X2 n=2 Tax=Oryx dammah TaxID=59534 RepID=UPI001A9AE36C|nr:actin-associated protein FAM107A isoform X2 [Oryx dammah]
MNRPVEAAPPGSPRTLVQRGPAALRSEVLFPRTQAQLRTSMYSEIQRERADIGGLMARPEHREWNPELIKPKKLLNPVKASRNHQEMHRELLMNHRRGLGVDSKPELQRVLEHRRWNQLIKKKKEELEAKRLQCPFEQELLRRQQRLNQLEKQPEKEEDHAPEFMKVRENLRRITTFTSGKRAL